MYYCKPKDDYGISGFLERGINITNAADISIVKTAFPNPANPGGILTYSITVVNAGPQDAKNIVLTDITPTRLLNPEFSADGGISFRLWMGILSLGTLSNGESKTVLIRGNVASTAIMPLVNTAIVSSNTPDPDLSDNISTVMTDICSDGY